MDWKIEIRFKMPSVVDFQEGITSLIEDFVQVLEIAGLVINSWYCGVEKSEDERDV